MADQTEEASFRRRLYFIGAAIGAVMLIIILVLIILLSIRSSGTPVAHRCRPSRTMPDMEALKSERRNLASPTLTSLANMAGYIYYYNEGFVPLVLSRLEDDGSTLSFIGECGGLYLKYRRDTVVDPSKILLDTLYIGLPLQPSNATPGTNPEIGYYSIPIQDSFNFPWNSRFSCINRLNAVFRISDDGYGYGKPFAELVLGALEFELSFAGSIKTGSFDKLPQPGSCQLITH